MRAVVLNCTLKKSPDRSNTDLLAQVVVDELAKKHVEVTTFRLADHTIPPASRPISVTATSGRGSTNSC